MLGWLIFLSWMFATIDTQKNGFFIQQRIGQFGKPFYIIKLRSYRGCDTDNLRMISSFGIFIRKVKIDEWPQLINVLIGDMSMVGPRPDVPGYYDQLQGEERNILELKPGLTSSASLKYANETDVLDQQQDPLRYNDMVIFPDKVRMNLDYYYKRSFWGDIRILFKTFFRKYWT